MSALPIVTILSEGEVMPGFFNLVSLETIKRVNKIPFAQLRLLDGDVAKQSFDISGGDYFKLGKKVEIKIGFQDKEQQTIFVGLVISHNIKSGDSGSVLIIELTDPCSILNGQRNSAVFTDSTDVDVFKKIISKNGLTAGVLDKTKAKHHQLIQYQCSDWDFILMRADVCSRLVYTDDGKLSVRQPKLDASAKHKFTYGMSECFNFDMEANINQQYGEVSATNWDINQQELKKPDKASEFPLSQGNITAKKSGSSLNRASIELNSSVNSVPDEMSAWADARMLKNRLSMFRGTITLKGDASIKVGDILNIDGVGATFNGKTLITGINHTYTEYGWRSILQFGLSAQWYSESQQNIAVQPAAGLLPGISGLQLGIVEDFSEDPEHLLRLKINIPALSNEGKRTVWARMSMAYAGKNKGLLFIPETGDEVIVGFINEDPRQAIILGSAYSEKNSIPEQLKLSDSNFYKGIITRGDLKLLFDDEKKIIKIQTPDNNEICLDKEKGISLQDKHGSKVVMNEKGICFQDGNGNCIEMHSQGITFKSVGNLNAEADGEIELTASSNMSLKASMIDLN